MSAHIIMFPSQIAHNFATKPFLVRNLGHFWFNKIVLKCKSYFFMIAIEKKIYSLKDTENNTLPFPY